MVKYFTLEISYGDTHTFRVVSVRTNSDVLLIDVNSQFTGQIVSFRQNCHWWLAVTELDADDISRESFGRAVFLVKLPALTAIA